MDWSGRVVVMHGDGFMYAWAIPCMGTPDYHASFGCNTEPGTQRVNGIVLVVGQWGFIGPSLDGLRVGWGEVLGLHVHGDSMHGDALIFASFDVTTDWDPPVEIPSTQPHDGTGGMFSHAHDHSSFAESQKIMGSMDIDPRTSKDPSSDQPTVDTDLNMEFMVPLRNSVPNQDKKKQNPVIVKSSSQQYAPVCSKGSQTPAVISGIHKSNTPDTTRDVNKSGVNKPPTVGLNATNKASKGFNFARAVQGDKGSKSQQPAPSVLSSKNAALPNPIDLVSSNRFSVLDIPNSIKLNKLIEVQDDLYPPDQGLEEGMDLEINKSKCGDNVVCQLNREDVDGSRILPESILSPQNQGGNTSRGKSYGISDEQKKDIADRLKNSGCIKVDIVDQWCPGQWDYFNDLCTLMGLDPDYCIEDVDSDTENGTSQFLSFGCPEAPLASISTPPGGSRGSCGVRGLSGRVVFIYSAAAFGAFPDLCNTNQEVSAIPSVTVSSTASDQVMGSFRKDGSEKNASAVAGNLVAGKTVPAGNLGLAGTAGRSDSDSSGSPGALSLNTGSGSNSNSGNNSCSMNESGGLRYAGANSVPLRTPLFSLEFKAMLGRDYPKTRTVFSPNEPVSGEAAVAPSQVESDGVSVSLFTDERVHVPTGGFDRMHGEHDEQGSNLETGSATEVGVHVTCVPVGFDGAMQAHAGNTNLDFDMGGLHGTLGEEAGVGMPNQTLATEMVQVDNGILKANELVTNVDKENGEMGWDVKKTRDTGKKDKKKSSIVSPNCVETSLPCGPVTSSDDGGGPRGHIEVQPASLPKVLDTSPNLEVSNQGSVPPLPRNGSSSRRFSPYGSNKGFGAVKGKGKGANRKEKGQNKYSPMLSELRVTEFVHETTVKEDRQKGGDIPATLGLNSYVEGATDDGITNLSPVDEATGNDSGSTDCDLNTQPDTHQMVNSVWNSPGSGLESFADKIKKSNELTGLKLEYFPPSISPDGGCRIHISQEDLKLSAQAYTLHLYGYFLGTSMDYRVAAPAVSKQNATNVNEDGFVTVSIRKKVGPIKVQGRKQKPVKVKAATQQYEHVRPTSRHAPAGLSEKQVGKAPQVNQVANKHGVLKPPTVVPNATKKGSTGFNFARAVQDIDTANRFSVLDIPNSVKFNKLIEVQDDLYPPDQSLNDGMDLDMFRSKDGQNMECQSNQKWVGDHSLDSETVLFQTNREHIEGVRILPTSVLSSPRVGGSPTTSAFLLGPGHSGKTYGISDEQKRAIADRLKISGSISMDIVDQWCLGQWDFFNDHCTLMGLDPDYCIEDVESDTENGTAHFFSAQMKVGMPKAPSHTQPSTSK
ncbi:hypothetical protein L1987_82140 [Smallanthus sonchifolius]|uniref:Uncharacterized protein n=1 Tax=Smallanthus sonchifolius TaxID=185202 RepID=A0ACB8YSD3_9ASTR|nr:hypothetical protein L1987_82140 [Smallanthus sonchifolius]